MPNDAPNQELVNDTMKLIMHRFIARALASDPTLVKDAKSVLAEMALRFPSSPFVLSWQKILDLPVDQIRRRLTSRDREMAWLRLSSPFVVAGRIDFTDSIFRRRMRRSARRLIGVFDVADTKRHVAEPVQ